MMKFITTILHLCALKMRIELLLFADENAPEWAFSKRKGVKLIILKESPKPLGRWITEICNIQMNNKIDLSNEDHCGPCGQYVLDKIQIAKNNDKTVRSKEQK
jgi:hypothetical protein